MAAYCFVCDAPVDGDVCGTCGRPPTWVEDRADDGRRRRRRARTVPRWVWPVVALVVAAVAFSLMRAGFSLQN